ncbi:MAG: efflux RND transporter periplasmic adaptor subunit [Deltaproteobacteria bacterium]|nr:efflux RND transporter periplasmic adaptor subunit [Deltaproteobacteria bacterium]
MSPDRPRISGKALIALAAIAALVLLLLYLQGTFGRAKVTPGVVPLGAEPGEAGRSVTVEVREVDDLIDWPGTVGSRSVANVASKVMARVLAVHVVAGAAVKAGEVMAALDDRDVQARLQQARAALAAAEAQATHAEADQRRLRALFKQLVATQQDLDAVDARTKGARALAAQARDALAEADVLLGETTVRAPFDGVVAERLVDPGDTATPGRALVVIHDPASLRLEARVSEQCAGGLSLGRELVAHLDAPERELVVQVEEIAPMADPASRTFLIRAGLPPGAGLRPGTYGSLRIPCAKHTALLIPAAAVTRTGQLESVRVVSAGSAHVRHVRTGKTFGDLIEVLSGLRAGEQVVVEAQP